jgi:hypothetical protein
MKFEGRYGGRGLFLKRTIIVDLPKRCFTKIGKVFSIIRLKDASRPLPKVNYILMFKTLYNKCQSCSVNDFENDSLIQLSFVHDDNKKLIVHESGNIDEIKNLALQLAAELKVNIRDGATDRRNPKWLR